MMMNTTISILIHRVIIVIKLEFQKNEDRPNINRMIPLFSICLTKKLCTFAIRAANDILQSISIITRLLSACCPFIR